MGDKRRADKHKAKQLLQRNQVNVQNHNQIRPNAGSETFRHLVAKTAVCHIGINNGYWVSSEVETAYGEVDVCLWGNPDRLTYAVEVETGNPKAVKEDKLNRYVERQPGIDDMILINVTDMPVNMLDALGYVSDQLGLDL
jgi:hypothetical protein